MYLGDGTDSGEFSAPLKFSPSHSEIAEICWALGTFVFTRPLKNVKATVNKVFKYSGMVGDMSFILGAFCFEESEDASE